MHVASEDARGQRGISTYLYILLERRGSLAQKMLCPITSAHINVMLVRQIGDLSDQFLPHQTMRSTGELQAINKRTEIIQYLLKKNTAGLRICYQKCPDSEKEAALSLTSTAI